MGNLKINKFFLRYELLEPQDQDHRRDETPPPLPARQNYQVVIQKGTPSQKKERESHYTTGKQFLDSVRHHNHDHFAKESNYVSPRVLQENMRQENYQRLESAHRNQEIRNQDHRSPDIRNQDHRSPDIRNQDHRSSEVRGQDHRSPDIRSQEHRNQEIRSQEHRNQEIRNQEHRTYEIRTQEHRNHEARNQEQRNQEHRNHDVRVQEHRNADHIPQNYVKQQKEKYEVKESVYASQREMHKNESHSHQKLGTSTSLPLTHNSGYSIAKSGSNNNLIRYNEYEQYEHKPDRNSKYEIYEEKRTKHEDEVRQREKRTGYDFEETYERRSSKYESDVRNELRFANSEQQNSEGKHEEHDHIRDIKRYYEIPHEFKVGEKVTCLKTTMSERPVPHKVSFSKNYL